MGYRYIGAKSKIIDVVLDKIHDITRPGAHVADLMSGTATVSGALRDAGYTVTAVDVMTYSYHHARVALLLNHAPAFTKARALIARSTPVSSRGLFPSTSYEQMIESLNALPPIDGYFLREFSVAGEPAHCAKPRNYFKPENARKIDAIRTCIRELRQQGALTSLEHSLLLHDLIMSTNDIANIAGTYGHYLSRLTGRAKDDFVLKGSVIREREDGRRHRVFRGYAEDLAEQIACDVCYIDPPYMKRQYAANYHILETLAREDEPEAIGVSGLRPWRDQYSNFCTKTRIQESFSKILSNMDCRTFLVSYSEDGLLSIDQLVRLFSRFGKVEVDSFKHKRFRSNASPLESQLTEYLVHLEKPA